MCLTEMLLVVKEEHHLLYERLGVIRISRLKLAVCCHDSMKAIQSLRSIIQESDGV